MSERETELLLCDKSSAIYTVGCIQASFFVEVWIADGGGLTVAFIIQPLHIVSI